MNVAPKEQPPRKLSGKRTVIVITLESRLCLTEGVNLSGSWTDGDEKGYYKMEKTALYNFHKNLGAKFVPFAGYEMPIQYTDGIVKEHISTRQSAGFFDVSHMGQLYVSGNKSSEQNLEKIIPLDFKEIKMNQSKYSFLINEKGGVIDDLIITRVGWF